MTALYFPLGSDKPLTISSDYYRLDEMCLEHLLWSDNSVKWKLATLYCTDCRKALHNYLKDKSEAELIKLGFMRPELRLNIREHLQNRKARE